jgi:hypothetical protein
MDFNKPDQPQKSRSDDYVKVECVIIDIREKSVLIRSTKTKIKGSCPRSLLHAATDISLGAHLHKTIGTYLKKRPRPKARPSQGGKPREGRRVLVGKRWEPDASILGKRKGRWFVTSGLFSVQDGSGVSWRPCQSRQRRRAPPGLPWRQRPGKSPRSA